MKLFFYTLVALLFVTSCSTIEDNSPALQGVRNNVLLRTQGNRALMNPDGTLTIQGELGAEEINFLVTSQGVNQINFGGSNSNPNIASYRNESGTLYTTATSAASGFLRYTINNDNTVSGTFEFTSFTPTFSDTVVFNKGVIFKVPISN